MFPNPSVLNEEPLIDNDRMQALSYASLKQMLSPPPAKMIISEILPARNKTKSHTYGLIDSKGAEEYLLKVVQNNDIAETVNLLDEAQNINICTIVDHKKYTLLHLAAYNNNIETVRLLLEHVRKQYKHKHGTILAEWVNKQTEDGFAAFHFGAYRGNIDMIKEFEKCGANLFLLNQQGMNGLHLAAQGDQPKSIVYFKKLGFDFSLKDSKGGTALHWAAYYGCELAVNYLLSFDEKLIDVQDIEGLSALHLATMSGNARIVKKLLLKGANKSLKNKEGLLAADIAKQNDFASIYKMLTESQNFLITYFSISQGFRRINRSKEKMVKFLFMLLSCQAISLYYIFRDNNESNIVTYCLLQIVVWVLLIFVWQSNPGKLAKQQYQVFSAEQHKKLDDLMQHHDAADICPDCICVKTKRSRHCDICRSCIKVYDHHCPWVDNCIGTNNHGLFYIFVIFLCIDITTTFTLQLYYFIESFQVSGLEWIIFGVTILTLLIMLLFLFPLWFLLFIQTKNLFTGKTTYERFSQSNKKNGDEKSECKFSNCLEMICYNKKNTRISSTTKQSMQLYNSQN